MRIAFASIEDPDDIASWSGTTYHMYRGLVAHGLDVVRVGPMRARRDLVGKALTQIHRWRGRRYDRHRHPAILADYARIIAARAAKVGANVVLAPSSLPVAYLDSRTVKVFWTDSTFANAVDFYPAFCNLSARTRREGHAAEARSLATCTFAAYSSVWATNSARRDYGVAADRLMLLPFGPNLEPEVTPSEARVLSGEKDLRTVRLLFIGVEWQRKGGDFAIAVADELARAGVPVELTVVGCRPELTGPPPPWLTLAGFISKREPDGQRELRRLLRRSHFLILPSRADCTPCVFSEAASYALPVLTTAVGGIPSVVNEGVSGHAFPLAAPATEWADVVRGYRDNPLRYRDLSQGAYDEYRARLNWPAAVNALVQRLKAVA